MSVEEENLYAAPQSNILGTETFQEEGELADRSTRLAAAILDGILAMVVTIPLMFAFGVWEMATSGKAVPFHMTLMMAAVGVVAFIAFHAYLLKTAGQTIGKKVMGIAIVSVENGTLLPLGKLFGLRYAPIWVTNVIPGVGQFLPLIDILFIFREDRRCVHDLIAGTKVVKVKK